MSTDDDLASAYAALARPARPGGDPLPLVRRTLRRRARRRRSMVAVAAAALVAVVGVGLQTGSDPTPGGSSAAGAGAAAPRGALPAGAQGCAVEYDRRSLAERDWAVDATVTRIGWGRETATVDLDVHTWYRGGTGSSLELRLPGPRSTIEDAPPTYAVGTRLLVSGARSGGTLVAWSCGFTRYHDERTATVWAEVFR